MQQKKNVHTTSNLGENMNPSWLDMKLLTDFDLSYLAQGFILWFSNNIPYQVWVALIDIDIYLFLK